MKRSRLKRNVKSTKKTRLKKPEFFERNILTEREVLLLKRRLNHGKLNPDELFEKMPSDGWKLTSEQTDKGLKWLMNQWKTPTGAERKNNPFGYREQDIIENFGEFRLIDFVNMSISSFPNYLPVYEAIRKDGKMSFQYYVDWKGIHITG